MATLTGARPLFSSSVSVSSPTVCVEMAFGDCCAGFVLVVFCQTLSDPAQALRMNRKLRMPKFCNLCIILVYLVLLNVYFTDHKESVMKNLEELEAGLYLVATPIGNLRDITVRALDVLKSVDVILCEDTRVSGKLLKAYDIRSVMRKYNDHSDGRVREEILDGIARGQSVGLISDAGTPLICDPGYKLVLECQARDLMVTSVPGASAPVTALQLSGMESDAFSFIGFLPSKTKARRDFLGRWVGVPGTLVAFETAPRLLKALEDIQDLLGVREVAVVREITKLYEEVRRASVHDLIMYYREQGQPKGEIVLVISAADEETYTESAVEDMIRCALETMHNKDAAAFVAEKTGLKKSDLYNLALRISQGD